MMVEDPIDINNFSEHTDQGLIKYLLEYCVDDEIRQEFIDFINEAIDDERFDEDDGVISNISNVCLQEITGGYELASGYHFIVQNGPIENVVPIDKIDLERYSCYLIVIDKKIIEVAPYTDIKRTLH